MKHAVVMCALTYQDLYHSMQQGGNLTKTLRGRVCGCGCGRGRGGGCYHYC